MKTIVLSLMFASLTTLIGATAASAQMTERMQFKTTFPFTAGNTTYPAGTFSVKPADDADNTVLEISNGTTTTLLVVQPEELHPNQKVKDEVVFRKYGDRYVLSDIWDASSGTGARAEMSAAERRHAAKHHGKPTKESVPSSKSSRS
jgi:hypothetical protein